MTIEDAFIDPRARPSPIYSSNPAVVSLLDSAEQVAVSNNNGSQSSILSGSVPASNNAVGISNFAIMSSSGSISLQSNSDSSFSSACTTERKRRTCVCRWGDACQIMTTAFAYNKNDPRGAFVILPSYEVQMIMAYCRYLKEDNQADVPDNETDDIEDEEFVVAVHHFHPTVIEKFFNTARDARLEDDLLPMPARTMTPEERASLVGICSDSDRVVNHQTGAPTGEFWVVPSYPFEQSHEDLKKSMGNMRQHDLERCVRRMKREARRQKWDAIVDKWEAVSKRSGFHTSAALLGVHTPPPNPGGPARHSLPPIITTSSALATTNMIGRSSSAESEADYGSEWDEPAGPNRRCFRRDTETWDPSEQLRRGSLMTAQEVLESELEEDDDESVPDLNALLDDDLDDIEPETAVPEKPTASKPHTSTEPAAPKEEKPEGDHPKVEAEEEKKNKKAASPTPQQTDGGDKKHQKGIVKPNGLDSKGSLPKASTGPQTQDDVSLSSLSAEGDELRRRQSTASKESSKSDVTTSTGNSSSSSSTSSASSQELLATDPTGLDMVPKGASVANNSKTPSLQSRAIRVLAMGVYCAFLLNLTLKAGYCIGVLKTHQTAFA